MNTNLLEATQAAAMSERIAGPLIITLAREHGIPAIFIAIAPDRLRSEGMTPLECRQAAHELVRVADLAERETH